MSAEEECGGGEVDRLRAEVADLRKRMARLEGDPAESGCRDCRPPVPDAPTAFTWGALAMLVLMVLLR